jgi:hypothetical protein
VEPPHPDVEFDDSEFDEWNEAFIADVEAEATDKAA